MPKGTSETNSAGEYLQEPTLVVDSAEFSEVQEGWNLVCTLVLPDGSARCGSQWVGVNDPEATEAQFLAYLVAAYGF